MSQPTKPRLAESEEDLRSELDRISELDHYPDDSGRRAHVVVRVIGARPDFVLRGGKILVEDVIDGVGIVREPTTSERCDVLWGLRCDAAHVLLVGTWGRSGGHSEGRPEVIGVLHSPAGDAWTTPRYPRVMYLSRVPSNDIPS